MSYATIVMDDQGDWIGLYANGTLAHEGHSIEVETALKTFANSHLEDVSSFTVKQDWIVEEFAGRLPYNLNEIPQGARS